MGYNLLRTARDQPVLLAPDLRDWLPDRHLAGRPGDPIHGRGSGAVRVMQAGTAAAGTSTRVLGAVVFELGWAGCMSDQREMASVYGVAARRARADGLRGGLAGGGFVTVMLPVVPAWIPGRVGAGSGVARIVTGHPRR